MAYQRLTAAMRRSATAAAVALLAVGALSWAGGATLAPEAEARAPSGTQQIGGTWNAIWQNSKGAPRKGLIVIDQSGSQLSARIDSHGGVTATGSIEGSTFTLHGTRYGLPFTITGRLQGGRMSGVLTAILTERQFTATRRRGR